MNLLARLVDAGHLAVIFNFGHPRHAQQVANHVAEVLGQGDHTVNVLIGGFVQLIAVVFF